MVGKKKRVKAKQAPSKMPEREDDRILAVETKKQKLKIAAGGSKELELDCQEEPHEQDGTDLADSSTPSEANEGRNDDTAVTRTNKRKRRFAGGREKEVEEHAHEEPEGQQGFSKGDLEALKSHKLFEQGVMPNKTKKDALSDRKKTDLTQLEGSLDKLNKQQPDLRKGKDVDHPTIDPQRIFIAGFPRCTPHRERVTAVREQFEQFGEITEVEVPLDSKAQCMGIAFVGYTNKAAAAKAMSQSGTELLGVTIEVKPAFVPRKKRKPATQTTR